MLTKKNISRVECKLLIMFLMIEFYFNKLYQTFCNHQIFFHAKHKKAYLFFVEIRSPMALVT